jgi:vancomycin resistance protein YoaR
MSAATESVEYRTYGRRPRSRLRLVLLVLGGFIVAATAALGAQAYATRDVIVPGVSVEGIDVGGMTPAEASARLASTLGARLTQPITVETPGGTALVTATQAGISIDVAAAVRRAYGAGRVEQRLLPYVWSSSLKAPLVIPASAPLPAPLKALERVTTDARLRIASDGTVTVTPAQTGAVIDPRQALDAIAGAALSGGTTAKVPAQTIQPAVSTAAAEAAGARATALLSAPIVLAFRGKRVGTLDPAELAPLLRATATAGTVALAVSRKGLEPLLADVARAVERKPVDATFKTGPKKAHLVAAKRGRELNLRGTAAAIAIADQSHHVVVAVQGTDARFTTANARALGIKEAMFKVPITTQMGASSANRIWNVHLLARILDGHIIKAGETFDFNKVVGERTLARGFRVGQQIENGVLVPSVGGGVCQVATTIYDSAFYAGLKVTARLNHMFYLSHYPLGMDATVSWGGPELRFVNTLKHALLMRTSYTDSTLSVQLYGTREGIKVESSTGPQVGNSAGGFTVTVFRTVKRGHKVIRKDSFTSVYIPQAPPKPVVKPKPAKKPPPVKPTSGTVPTN